MKVRFSILLLLLTLSLLGKEVPLDKAKQAAIIFLTHHGSEVLKSASMIELQLLPEVIPHPFNRSAKKGAEDTWPLLYIFSINQDEALLLFLPRIMPGPISVILSKVLRTSVICRLIIRNG